MSELNRLLKDAQEALGATRDAVERLAGAGAGAEARAGLAAQLDVDEHAKVSLLSLKNGAMLAYVSALMEVVGARMDPQCADVTAQAARERSVESRVVLERGVKPLEKKLGYQLEKLVRAYMRAEKEYDGAEKRAKSESAAAAAASGDEDDGSSSEDEELSYRPNMISARGSKSTTKEKVPAAEGDEEEQNDGVYRPPKINAQLPPQATTHFEDRFSAQDHRDRSGLSKLQAMDEYIKDQSEQPDWGTSIGADILDHGRGGIKSSRDTEKERRVTSFEEDNFTRVNHMGMNKAERTRQKRRQRAQKANVIGGEDFGIFSSKRKMEDSTSRRSTKKPRSAWDRAKRRM